MKSVNPTSLPLVAISTLVNHAGGWVLLLILSFSQLQAYTTERVVLVIIDGLRYSEGLGDPEHLQVPRMAALAEQGALVTDFQNDGATYTSRAIPAIWCGAWTDINSFHDPACDGVENNTSELPTVFEYFRKHLDRPASDCVYTLKELCSWKASFDPDYGVDYWPQYHEAGHTDVEVWHETEGIIENLAPHFLMMYLADVDSRGHSGDWDNYLSAITTADSIVGVLWDVLQADTAYAGKTTMMVTNDHGRHDYNFSGHGDNCMGCRQIQFLAVGPDIHVGLQSGVPRTIPDITPTIGELLGFPTEDATGTSMMELIDPTSNIRDVSQTNSPENFKLSRLYPSPFNGELTIEYRLNTGSPGNLNIFNLQGNLVWNKELSASSTGLSKVKWQGINNSWEPLPSGIYIVQLSTSNLTTSTRVLLLK